MARSRRPQAPQGDTPVGRVPAVADGDRAAIPQAERADVDGMAQRMLGKLPVSRAVAVAAGVSVGDYERLQLRAPVGEARGRGALQPCHEGARRLASDDRRRLECHIGGRLSRTGASTPQPPSPAMAGKLSPRRLGSPHSAPLGSDWGRCRGGAATVAGPPEDAGAEVPLPGPRRREVPPTQSPRSI